MNISIEWGWRKDWPKEETVYSWGWSRWKEIENKGLSAVGREWILWRKHRNKAIQVMCQLKAAIPLCDWCCSLGLEWPDLSDSLSWAHHVRNTDKHIDAFPNVITYWLIINSQGTALGRVSGRNLANSSTFLDSPGWGKQVLSFES